MMLKSVFSIRTIIKVAFYFIVISTICYAGSSLYYYWTDGFGFKTGFPFVSYLSFQLLGNESRNFSWFPENLIYNTVIHFVLALILFFVIDRKRLVEEKGKNT